MVFTKLSVDTSLVYGIWVSEKSYLIGLRNFLKGNHAKMLAARVIGSRMPQELINTIAVHLHELEKDTVRKTWNTKAGFKANRAKFLIADSKTQRAFAERLVSMNIGRGRPGDNSLIP